MNARRITTLSLAAVMSASCAINPQANPNYSLIDPAGVDMARYEADYRDCAALANQTDTAGRAAAAASGAAVFGAIVGALLVSRQEATSELRLDLPGLRTRRCAVASVLRLQGIPKV